MRRYFFDFFDGICWRKDTDGQEMNGLEDVIVEANRSLISLAPGLLATSLNGTFHFLVKDGHQKNVLRATLTIKNEVFET